MVTTEKMGDSGQPTFQLRTESLDGTLTELLRRGLDWLSRIAPYDLATVFILRGQELVVRAARGTLASDSVRGHVLPLADFPSLREALETRRARVFTELEHTHGDGDPFDGILDLPPGHSCMVVPLCAGDSSLGLLTLDRKLCETYAPEVVNLVEVYGQMLAIAIHGAGQKDAADRLHQQDHEHAKLLEAELGGDPREVLERSISEPMQLLVRQARQVAQTRTPVLIRGEAGTGKERLARALHLWSPRADQPFVTLGCAALPEAALEKELLGRLRLAERGTMFLDEVGALPAAVQVVLLRELREPTVDVRFIAATKLALEAEPFDAALLALLAVFPLQLPPLRERREDLPSLSEALLAELTRRTGRGPMHVSSEGLAKLAAYEWPGNVRELANVLERGSILANGRELTAEVLEVRRSPRTKTSGSAEVQTLAEVQRAHIQRVLERTRGRIYGPGGAAELLGVKPSTLQSKMKKLGLDRT